MSTAAVQSLSPNPTNEVPHEYRETFWQPVMDLPCQLTVELPLPNFKVTDFLALKNGSLITSTSSVSRDVPLLVNGVLVGWGELEGTGKRLAIRLTELA